jgi:hypothetical protein
MKRSFLVLLCLAAATALGQPQPSTPCKSHSPATARNARGRSAAAEQPDSAPAADQPAFKQEELEQMLAPIALYPDSLISQVLMASTYPIEVVEADRWTKANASLKGDALTKELEKQTWDASVRSLVNFPQVLAMMSENLSTTVKIGDAFIGQQKDVMDTIQKLRAKAKDTGNLKTTEQQTVTSKEDAGKQVIVIESASPQVVYVPQYNPTVVYGTWPYPSYPPYPYYPPGYVATGLVSFGVGVAVGAAWGYALGGCNWGHGDVDIDVNRNTNINNNIDRNKLKNNQRGVGQNGRGSFAHDPSHRQGAAYRNQSSANRVGAANTSARTSQARNDYRGRADAGRSDINRGGADAFKGNNPSAGNRAGSTPGAGNRAGGSPSAANRASPSTANRGSGALNGASGGGNAARSASTRGTSSRSSSPSAAARSSPSRSSGGGSRGGGGRGGGGGRR